MEKSKGSQVRTQGLKNSPYKNCHLVFLQMGHCRVQDVKGEQRKPTEVWQANGKGSPPEAGLSGARESSLCPPGSSLWAGRGCRGQIKSKKVSEELLETLTLQ